MFVAPNVFEWSESSKPIFDLFSGLNCSADDMTSVSYFNGSGIWNTRHHKLKYADAFASTLADDNNNVYVMVNEVQGLIPTGRGRGDASRITKLRSLWADLDFKDSGLKDADSAKQVISMLSGMLNSEPTAVVFSGYGLQPYWVVEDGSITENNRQYVSGLLKRWGQLVQRVASIEGGYVDPVYDLPRVLRAPGTYNFKEPDSPVLTRLWLSKSSSPLSLVQIEEVLEAYGFVHEDNPVDEFIVVSSPDSWEPAKHDCAWSLSLVDEITNASPRARHPWMVGKAVKIESAARNGCVTSETYEELVLLLRDKFTEMLTTGKGARETTHNEVGSTFAWARVLVSTFEESKLAEAVGYHTHKMGELRAVQNLPKELPSEGSIMNDEYSSLGNLALAQDIVFQEESFAFTDSANASRLAAFVSGKFIFVPNLGWHKWEDNRWVLDETKQIVQAAIDSAFRFAESNPSESTVKWVKRSLQSGALKSAVDLTESIPEIVCAARKLDSVSRELCTPDGIIDLESSELREGNPFVDRHTKQTTVAPDDSETPKWLEFLETIIVDKERIEYIQDLFGLALIGESLHHVLPLFVGTGANGKSTILEVASGILGDYVASMPENFLLDKGFQEHSTEIARLRGCRLAIGSETRPDGKFNESRVKMLTGGDTISARLIGKNFFDFKPTHTLILAMNHLPKVSAGGDGFWRRVRKINFDVTIPAEQQDKTLAQKLVKEEGAGILQWMIVGAKRVLASDELREPESVLIATKEYRFEEDNIAQFINDRIFVNQHMSYSVMEIYNNYKNWCGQESEQPLPRTQLIRELSHRLPLVKEKGRRGVKYTGIGLYEE
jgi:putative DNA primase/helicase